jgi:opacity protein-like surface antigen
VSASLKLAALSISLLSGLALASQHAQAQWWTAAPADYEDCAERAEKSPSKDARATALSNCESKFAGRRKLGGGYTYYDFMQNRSFDIAGPNPTTAEQKAIDEQYAGYLDSHRRAVIRAAFTEKQREVQQQAALDNSQRDAAGLPGDTKLTVLPKPRPKIRVKEPDCSIEPVACGWSKLSTGLKDFKDALFGGAAPPKTKRI